ncbi:MAG: hypothetical protein LBS37_05535, partial [Treponema sp.]|nr:hypothetical protein [Treponema sp.]
MKIYANGSADENPDEISDYFKTLIESGEIKPLSLLENIEKEKYDLVINYLPENEKVDDYYFSVTISIIVDEKTVQHFTPEKYNLIKELPEYKNLQIKNIE